MFFRFNCSENDATIRWQLYCYKWFPALKQIIQETASLFLQTHEKHIVSEEYCNARHDDKMCFLANCRYLIIMGNLKDLLQKLDAFCFNYQHVDCLYALFKYRFDRKIVIKSGQLFDKLQRAVHFNKQNREVDRMPSNKKKRLLRKSTKTFVELFPKDQIDAS